MHWMMDLLTQLGTTSTVALSLISTVTVSIICFLATVFNTGTVTVSLNYTRKVFFSQPDCQLNANSKVKVKVTLRLTVSQLLSLGDEPHLWLVTRYLLLFTVTVVFL
jgi:hypothetical protein